MEETQNKEHLNLNQLKHNEKGEILIVHREDDAKIVHAKKPLVLKGTITAPGNFIVNRKEQEKFDRSHVKWSLSGLYITLITRENHPLAYEVTGELIKNPEIEKLCVNTKKTQSVKELAQLLRFNKYFFADGDQNIKIVENLMKFKVTAQTHIEKEEATRGNEKDIYEIKGVDSNIDLTFELQMPIYVGQAPKKFKVEILYKIRERNVEVWLESPELADLWRSNAEEIIKAELARMPEAIVQIEQK
jgi:hypothetical protein